MRITRILLNNNIKYLNQTIIPTFHFQKSLPKLPIPKLEQTMEKYLYFSKPLLTNDEFEKTKKLVDDFELNIGKRLNKELIEQDKSIYSSYISKPWTNMYLESRKPLIVNYNPQLTLKDDPKYGIGDQAKRASSIIYSSLKFYKTLKDEMLEPDIFHTKPNITFPLGYGYDKNPALFNYYFNFTPKFTAFHLAALFGAYALDMSQYKNLFASTRVPNKEKDFIKTHSNSKHIIIQHNSSFWKINVFDKNNNIVKRSQLTNIIDLILKTNNKMNYNMGSLTTLERNEWTKVRNLLEINNKDNLQDIDSALFMVCLEDDSPQSMEDIQKCMLHGNGKNRWFDKSFQIIITKNSKCGINFEHSWGDGISVLRFCEEIFKDSIKYSKIDLISTSNFNSEFKKLEWNNIDSNIKNSINKAENDLNKLLNSLNHKVVLSEDLNKNYLKQNDQSPDGTMQLIIQLAYYLKYNKPVSIYEAASTGVFKHGRTETIRPLTPESLKFTKSIFGNINSKEQYILMKKALEVHSKISLDAKMGKGMDRHLFALLDLAKLNNNKIHDLFLDKSYYTLNNIKISTSTLNSKYLESGGFGPVNNDCYGIGYGINEEKCGFTLSSYNHNNLDDFAEYLNESLNIIKNLINNK